MRRVLAVALLAGCAHGSPAKAPSRPAVTLKKLAMGDLACYLVVERADGSEKSLEGDFDLCPGGSKDASALIGKRITYTTRWGKTLAASCEGRADCGESDDVELVVTIVPAD